MKPIILLLLLFNFNKLLPAKYSLLCNRQLLEQSLKIAIREVGTMERTGNNDGEVEKYTNLLALPKYSPYCAAGQYWSFYTAAKFLKMPVDFIPIVPSGRANAIYEYAMNNGIKSVTKPVRHDLIIWRRGKTAFGHVERILNSHKSGWVETVGFNTSSGNREGVFIKKRNIYHPLARTALRGFVGFIPTDK